MKLPNKAASPVSTPAPEPEATPVDDIPMDDIPMDDAPIPSDDKPFDDTEFDAGVDADVDEDPKKFLEQLAGKMQTELRSYTKKEGKPDFELEKYIINSVISATHTAEMEEEDRKDIINKIEDSGKGDDEPTDDEPTDEETPDEETPIEDEVPVDEEEPIDEGDAGWVTDPKRSMFSNDEGFNNPTQAMWEEEMEESNTFELNELLGEEENLDELNKSTYNNAAASALGKGDEDLALDFLSHSNEMGIDDKNNHREGNPTRYMFFSNLEQMRRQAGLLLDLDEGQIEAILNSGHDWAADHIATAKESFDQVFDFLMNETKSGDMWKSVDIEDHNDEEDYSEWSKPMELEKDTEISDGLKYHLDNKLALGESVYRYGSDNFLNLLKEVKKLYNKGLIKLNENDTFIVNDFDNKIRINGQIFQLGQIMESEEENDLLNEAEYQGKTVKLGKPKRGGSKKFYVYVKNPKNGKIKKVSFGAKSGGGKLSVKLKDPEARKAFADRHNCEQKNDKTTPGYWSCRLPRYAKLLGLSGGGKWW